MCGDRRAHASIQHLSTWLEIMAEKVFSRVFSNSRVNIFSNTLKLHKKAHTAVRSRPTVNVERFRNGSNLMRDHELYQNL